MNPRILIASAAAVLLCLVVLLSNRHGKNRPPQKTDQLIVSSDANIERPRDFAKSAGGKLPRPGSNTVQTTKTLARSTQNPTDAERSISLSGFVLDEQAHAVSKAEIELIESD